jgi:hypothetical protein
MGHDDEYRVIFATHFLFTFFQLMAWMYINAAMQQYAVRRPGGNGISPIVVHFGHDEWAMNTEWFALPISSGGECVWLV